MSRTRKNNSLRSTLISVVAVVAAVIIYFAGNALSSDDNKPVPVPVGGNVLAVHYLDVGQGDSEFIEFPNGECMLIDAGTADSGEDIVSEIKELGYTTINYLVATHPHTDHIGGMEEVVRSFEIKNVYMPRASTNTKTFEGLLTAIREAGVKINTANAGKVVIDTELINAVFLSPSSDNYSDLNNYSCVLKLTYGNSSFLFTGDAEKPVEEEMLSAFYNKLDCDVLKVGHHGSRYSSTKEFINAVSPEIAVISCGVGNSYNHPHKQAVNRLEDFGTKIYRTDKLGEITIKTTGDGKYELDY